MIPSAAPRGSRHRISSDDCWPLRGADGLTFAERAAQRAARTRRESRAKESRP